MVLPKSAKLFQFRYRGSVGFNQQWLVLVEHLLEPGYSLERHCLTLKRKEGTKRTREAQLARHKNERKIFGKCFILIQQLTSSQPTGSKKDNCALRKAGTMTDGVLLKGTSKNKI